jgi:HTH-type transcriptional regulator/antitoxin HigA
MEFAVIKDKARDLFLEAGFISHINSEKEYGQALALMDELIKDYDNHHLLIEVLSVAIERWENTSPEFTEFNKHISEFDGGIEDIDGAIQYGLGVSDLSEIGSKSLVSKIMNNERSLTRNHIEALSQRFGVSPALFF